MARKFQFNYEPILQLRKRKQQLSHQQLIKANAARAFTLAALERLDQILVLANREVLTSLTQGEGVSNYPQIIQQVLETQASHRRRLSREVQDVQASRQQLLLDMKECKKLQRLKELQASAHQADATRTALRESDDLYAMYAATNRQQGVAEQFAIGEATR